jgi:hypothetical protein
MQVGQKVIGFSWTPSEYPDLYYNQSMMDKHIGKVGVVTSVLSRQYMVKFTSENGGEASWEYPLALKERGIIKPVVGQQMQGFKFEDINISGAVLGYSSDMENYIGKVGTVAEVKPLRNRYRINFEDGEWWWYPLSQAWKGLIEEVNTNTNTNTNNQLNVSTMRTKGFFIKPNFGGNAPSGMTAVKWTAYINFINKVSKSTFTGNSYNDDLYYGIAMDGDGEATSDPERFGAGNVELNLDDWFKQFVSENLPSSGFYIKNDYCNCADQSIAEMHAFIHHRRISNNGKWRVYIEFLNTLYVGTCGGVFSGDAREDYYGITADGIFNNTTREVFFEDSKNLTLDGFWDMITGVNIIRPTAPEPIVEEEEVDVEMITDYAGNEQRLRDCVQLDEYAPNYGGEWALQDEVTYCEYNGGSCLSEDAVMEQGGDYFFVDTEGNHDIEYSEYEGEWLDTNRDSVHYGYVHGCEHETWFHIGGWSTPFEVDDNYFRDTDALEYHGYVEYDDEWMTEDQYNDMVRRSNNATYHSNERHRNGFIGTRPMRFGSDARFTIGFEIEKEDDDAVEIGFYDLYNRTGWVKEEDGSLDSCTGYELVSPAFDLYDSLIDQEIKDDEDLQTLINAGQSGACGGHINLASTVHSTEELFELLSGYFPLFYSIYEHRIDKTYSKAKKKHQYYDRDKYSAIFIKPNVLEFRIPSAVKNVNNLLWRRDLLRIMCSSIKSEKIKALNGVHYKPVTEADVLKMLVNPTSKLYKHMRKVFSHEAMICKVELFIQYSGSFNNTYLPRIIRSEFPTDNINNNVEHDQDGMGA